MPRLRYDDDLPPPRQPDTPRDQFAADLLALLDEHGDVASEALWQQLPKTIAKRWQSGSLTSQSPLSTWTMVEKCATMVLKIRLAKRRGGGTDAQDALEEFQRFMTEVTAPETDAEEESEDA